MGRKTKVALAIESFGSKEYTDEGPWTHFYDMHSGGSTKLKPYEHIFIQTDEESARKIFEILFDRTPDHITCDCCGNDYSVSKYSDLSEATSYHRERWTDAGKVTLSLDKYVNEKDVLLIPLAQIKKNITFKLVPVDLLLGDGNAES